MKHDADESSFGMCARKIPSSDATHRGGNHESNTSGGCLRSVCDAGSDGECLEGRCPRREPRTTWRAKPLFDRRLECVDEASRAIRYVRGTPHGFNWADRYPRIMEALRWVRARSITIARSH